MPHSALGHLCRREALHAKACQARTEAARQAGQAQVPSIQHAPHPCAAWRGCGNAALLPAPCDGRAQATLLLPKGGNFIWRRKSTGTMAKVANPWRLWPWSQATLHAWGTRPAALCAGDNKIDCRPRAHAPAQASNQSSSRLDPGCCMSMMQPSSRTWQPLAHQTVLALDTATCSSHERFCP